MPHAAPIAIHWRSVALLPFLALGSGLALAQWQWVDGEGRKVFSDTPPPLSVPDKSILKRPGPRAAAPVLTTPAASDNPATAAAPRLTDRDELLEARRKQTEEAEQAKKKAQDDQLARQRAENCERARRAKATLDSGIRIATMNAKGEREIMDDPARAREHQRIDDILRADCGPRAGTQPAVQ